MDKSNLLQAQLRGMLKREYEKGFNDGRRNKAESVEVFEPSHLNQDPTWGSPRWGLRVGEDPFEPQQKEIE